MATTPEPKPLISVFIAYPKEGHASDHYSSLKEARDDVLGLFDHLIAGKPIGDYKGVTHIPAPTAHNPVPQVVTTTTEGATVQAPGPLFPGAEQTNDEFGWGTDEQLTAQVEAPLIKEADPEFEALLKQEEAMEASLTPTNFPPAAPTTPDPVQAVWDHVDTNSPPAQAAPVLLQPQPQVAPAPTIDPSSAVTDFTNILCSNLGFTVNGTATENNAILLVREGVVFQVVVTATGFKVFYDAENKWGKNIEINLSTIQDWGTALSALLNHSAEAYGVIKSSMPSVPVQQVATATQPF